MGNFLRRFLSFIFGMIFGFVALATAVVTMGYTVYKNASLNDLGLTKEEVNLGGLNDATIEELLALVLTATKDPTSYTFEDLEEDYDFDVNGLLTSFGIDPDTVHPDDLRAIKKIAPFALISSTGDEGPFDDIGLGVLFAFIPEVDGVYPIFSAGARSKLRSYTIGEAFATDETGNATLGTIFNSLPLGSILSSMYVETFDANNATYSYVSVDGGILDSFGNVTINELTTLSSDIGYEFNEGVLADLGSNSIGNLLGMGNDGSVFSTVLLNTTISDLFVKNGDVYAFDFFVLLNDLKVGSLMGMTYCDIDTGCNLEHNHVEGWYDGSGTLVTNEDIAGAIMLNLYDLGVESLINGSFDVTSLTTGIYFGQALGFTKGNDGKWYDANGTYAGDLNNAISNISLEDCMNGELSIEDTLGGVSVGGLMGMEKIDGEWYDANGNLVGDDIAGDLMKGLYDKTFNDLTSGSFDIAELTDGIYFGKALGYTKGNDGRWYDDANEYVGDLNNAISNISLEDCMNGNLSVEDALGSVTVGGLMGMEKIDGEWYDADGNLVDDEDIAGELMKGLYDKTFNDLLNGELDIAELTDGIYFGKALGYTKGNDGRWYDDANEYVGDLNNAISNISLKDCMSGELSIEDTLGSVTVGGIMGMEKIDGTWYDADGNPVGDDIASEIMKALYEKTFDDLTNGELDIAELTDGIYLGEALGYEIGETTDAKYCNENCTNDDEGHEHKFYWVDENGDFVGELEASISNISLKDCLSEEGIDIIGAIGDVKLGDIMGMTYCADPDCTDHLDGEGWYDADGYIIGDDVAGQIMKGLYEKTFNDLTNGGLDMAELTDGIYFGTALGYEIGTTTNAGYCAKDCTNAEEGHEHNFYWVDENGDFVGELENAISNIALKDCMGEEGVDIIGAIGDVKVGAIMGMTYCADPDCPDHVDGEGWYDADGYIVGDDISGRIMKGLYEKTFDELSNGELDFTELTKGIYLGEALGYTKCGDGCEISHVHRQDRWYTLNEESGEYEYVGDLNNEISKISIEELMGDEGVDINEIIGGVTLGGLMGAYYCDGVGTECYIDAPMHAHSKGWYDADGEFLSTDDASGDMANKLYELTVDELLADDFDFTTITEGIYLGRTFGYEIGEPINRNYCDKDCANDGFDHTHKYSWYDVDGKYVGDMDNAISNIELNTFLDSEEEGSIDFTEILADVKVGFVLGMTYCDGKDCELDHTHLTGWYGSDGVMVGDDVSGTIMSGLYELTFSELTGGAFDITTLTDGIYFGKALGYVKCVQGCTIDHGEEGHLKECEKSCKLVHNHTYDGKWYNEDGEYVGAMDNAISNISLKDCFEGNFDITTALNDVKLGEMMDMVYCGGSDETCHIKHPISNGHAGGWYELNEYGEYEKVMANDLGEEIMLKVYGLTYGEITESGIDFASITDGIYFGKALGYKQCTGNTGCPLGKEHNHATGKWFKVDAVTGKATYVGEMDNAIANIALSDAMQGKVDIDATINGIKLGEIMGKTRVENAGVVTWYDVNGNEIVFDNLSGSDRILYQMYDNTLEEFRRGDFSIETVFNGMYVGHVMGYKGGVDAWTKADGSSVTNLEMVMADIRMDDLINDRVNFQNIINGLKLGDVISGGDSAILNNLQNVKIGNLATEIDKLSIGKLMGYEERADGWYNNGVKVTGVYGALSKYSIGELTSGTINFDSFKVSEVINVGDSAILKLLADKTIGEAATAADNLLLGDVMGYTKQAQSGYCQVNCNEAHTHKFYWVKGGVPASKIAAKIANYTVAGVSDGLDNLTVGDVVDTSTGVFKIMETEAFTANGKTYAKVNSADEVPIDEIGARATEGVKNATYAELVGAGISLLTTQTEDSITNFYTVIYPTINLTSPVENWQQTKTLTQVITDIINTLNLIMQSR